MKNKTTTQMEIIDPKKLGDDVDAIVAFAQDKRKLCKGHAAFVFDYIATELKRELGITHFQLVDGSKFGEA